MPQCVHRYPDSLHAFLNVSTLVAVFKVCSVIVSVHFRRTRTCERKAYSESGHTRGKDRGYSIQKTANCTSLLPMYSTMQCGHGYIHSKGDNPLGQYSRCD